MDRDAIVNSMNAVRGFALHAIDGVSEEQTLVVPERFRNNILWNLGHICAVQCALLYLPVRRPSPLPRWYHRTFYDGTSPLEWDSPPSVEEIVGTLRTLNLTIVADLEEGAFEGYTEFELTPGLKIASAEEALAFHTVHEGIHLGVLMSLKKLVLPQGSRPR